MARRTHKFAVLSFVFSLTIAVGSARPCHAQAFGFSVGSGGHHHHGGWGFSYGSYGYGPWWGPGWGPGWYGPPVVYAPPPIVQPVVQPVYIQPQTVLPATPQPPGPSPYATQYSSSSAPAASTLVADNRPSLAGATPNDDRIVIRNGSGAQLPVTFLVDGQDVELTDGSTRTFVGKQHRTVQYDRGGRFGSTQQDLAGGQYEFRITSTGWDLVRKPDLVPSSRTAVRANSLPDANMR